MPMKQRWGDPLNQFQVGGADSQQVGDSSSVETDASGNPIGNMRGEGFEGVVADAERNQFRLPSEIRSELFKRQLPSTT